MGAMRNVVPNLSRRQFCRLLGAVGAGATFGACGNGGNGSPADKVLVIGAGIAGLTAANALTAAGVEVELIEGRNRVGGRIWTVDFAGGAVDLGAAWIHGPDGNPTACLMRNNGIEWRAAEVADASISAWDAENGLLSGTELLNVFLSAQVDFEAKAPSLLATLGPQASVADAVRRYLDDQGSAGDARRYAEFALLQGTFELFYGGRADDISLAEAYGDIGFSGGNMFPVGGYHRLVDLLANGLTIRTGETVRRIATDRDGVQVDTDRARHRGSHVIVTLPLGVLRAGSVAFEPGLPPAKRGAIDRLAMAPFEKIVLSFPRAFWVEQRRRSFVYISRTYGELPAYFDLTRFTGSPALLCFYAGAWSATAATRSDNELVRREMEILREMFGAGIPEPDGVLRTRWADDPFSRGAYSYVPVGATLQDMHVLGEPVGDRLLFAGEATVPEHYGTVTAAYVSGLREARRLLGVTDVDLLTGAAPDVGCA